MAVYKDTRRKTCFISAKYRDWSGKMHSLTRRGFKTKHDAQAYEQEFLEINRGTVNCSFSSFIEIYLKDLTPRLRETTLMPKDVIIRTKLVPYFGPMKMTEIKPKHVICWQNEILAYRCPKSGKPYSREYMKTMHNQLSAIFNHSMRYYGLKSNPARLAGNFKGCSDREMLFWTEEEYLQFAEGLCGDPLAHTIFETLYWTGIRECELLALTPADFDFTKQLMTINKDYHRLHRKDLITEPKTPKANRKILLPAFLCSEIQALIDKSPALEENARLFPVSVAYLHKIMKENCEKTGVKQIKIHGIRHSHISLLIHLGYSAVAIGDRVGHESSHITFRYAHLFPTVQGKMIQDLENIRNHEAS